MSNVQLTNVILNNSETKTGLMHKIMFNSPLSLIRVSSGTLSINKSIIQHNRGEMMIYAKDCMYKILLYQTTVVATVLFISSN